MNLTYIQQTINLKDYDDGAIIVFGNFALIKNTYHLERWQRNQMERQDIVDYFLKGTATVMDKDDEWELKQYTVGEDSIYCVSNKTTDIYIIY